MEFRDKLLSSEIRHVTDLVNMLSYEMVILQDFMTHQFGSRFKKFRDQHHLSAEVMHPESETPGPAPKLMKGDANISTNNRIHRSHKRKTASQEISEQASNASGAVPLDQLDDTPKSLHDPLADVSQTRQEQTYGEDEHSLSDPNYVEANATELGACDEFDSEMDSDYSEDETLSYKSEWDRSRKTIWTHFDCKRLPNGKKRVNCRKCLKQVSTVAKRLEKHYQQCVLGEKVSSTPNLSVSVKIDSDSGEGSQRKVPRKPLGAVWNYFNKTTNSDGLTVVTCQFCEKRVSNHATRMSKHLQKCSKSPCIDLSH